jgi:predicted O-methyltransferase YrrM
MTGVEYYCQVSDVQLLKSIVRSLPDNPICVNIGVGLGTSALAMLEARPDSRIIGIDIDDCPEAHKAIDDAGYYDEDRYRFYKFESQELGRMWKLNLVDFVFVDGGHKYDECYNDAVIWWKILKPKGFMAFHDYESQIQILESVKRAVDDFSKEYELKSIARDGTMIVFWKVT